MNGDCEIRIAGSDGRPLLRCNDMPHSIQHCIEDAPRYAQHAGGFGTSPRRVVVVLNGRVIYSHTPTGTPRFALGITVDQRLARRQSREANARALRKLQGASS